MRHATPPEGVDPDLDASLDALLKLAFLDDASGGLPLEPAPAEGAVDGLPEFGHFRILRELGRGGMGVVYLAEDLRLHRNVAIKVLTAFAAHSPALRKRLLREAEAASKLDHPTICNVHEVGEANGQPFIAMQYVEGETLAKKIAERRSASGSRSHADSGSSTTARREEVLDAVKLVETVARALHAAHESGLVHRDIKPANIMVTTAGAPVLLDFGLARDTETDAATLTQTGQVMGTPGYMAPEQLRGERATIDRRVDVYALGVTLYECLTMRRPFHAATREQLYAKILASDPPDPRRKNPAIPRDLRVVLDTALEKDPDRRYQSAEDLADDLRRVREQRPIRARPVSPAGRLIRWARRRPARAALIAVLVIGVPLLAGLGGYVISEMPAIEEQRRQSLEAEVERNLELGYGHMEHGDQDVSREAFDRALELNPDCVEAVGGKALSLLEEEKPEACLAFLDTRADLLEKQPILHDLRDDALRDLGREAEAANLEHAPRTDVECFLVGMRLMRHCVLQTHERNFRKAVSWFQKAALRTKLARRLYHIQIAHAAGHVSGFNERGLREGWQPKAPDPAIRELCHSTAEALAQLWPDSPDAHNWASLALLCVDHDASLAAAHRVLELEPEHPRALHRVAHIHCLHGEYDEAIEILKRVAAMLPGTERKRAALGFLSLGAIYCDIESHRNLPEARRMFLKALEFRPDDPRAMHGLGRTYLLDNQLDEAHRIYTRMTEIHPKRSLSHVQLGVCLRCQEDYPGSIAAFERARVLKPECLGLNDASAHFATALHQTGQPKKAVAVLKEGLRLGSTHKRVYLSLGFHYLFVRENLDVTKAVQVCEKARALYPKNPQVLRLLGRAYQADRQGEKAIEALEAALAIDTKSSLTHAYLATALVTRRSAAAMDRAIGHYTRALKLDSDTNWVRSSLGILLVSRGRYEEAVRNFERHFAAEGVTFTKVDYCNYGCALQNTRQPAKALRQFDKALELDSNLRGALYGRGRALLLLNRPAEAVVPLERAAALKPDQPATHALLGSALFGTRNPELQDRAIEQYRRAIELKCTRPSIQTLRKRLGTALVVRQRYPEAVAVHDKLFKAAHGQLPAENLCNYGVALLMVGRLDEALARYTRAAKLKPRLLQAHFGRGRALSRLGRYEEAIPALEETIALDSKFGWPYALRGGALAALDRDQEAVESYEKAIARGHRHPSVYCNLGFALLNQGKLEEALQSIRKGHSLAAGLRKWSYPSETWVRQCERMVALQPTLELVLQGQEQPASSEDSRLLAKVAAHKKRYGASAALYQNLFELEPKWLSFRDPLTDETLRYLAAWAAMRIGLGQGEDADNFDAEERATWRRKALVWLRDDLAEQDDACGDAGGLFTPTQRLMGWKRGPLRFFLKPAETEARPEAEQAAWRDLGRTIDERIHALEQAAAPAQKSPEPAREIRPATEGKTKTP